jgi:hypothetical protein
VRLLARNQLNLQELLLLQTALDLSMTTCSRAAKPWYFSLKEGAAAQRPPGR